MACISFGVLVSNALANGYGDAKALIEKAEKAFDAGEEDEALALLDEALRMQTTVDKKKEPYGYARYILLRLGKHWLGKGDIKKSEKLVKKAMAAPEDQDWVDEAYWVSPFDPFIMTNFPDLSGLKVEKRPPQVVMPDCIGLRPGKGKHLYGLGNKKVYRLDRTTLELTTLYERTADYLYRMDTGPDDLVFYYEGDKHIYHLTMSPYAVSRVPRGANVSRLHKDAKHVVVFDEGGYSFKVVRTALAEPHGSETLLKAEGRVLGSSADHLSYATWSYVDGKNFHPYYSPRYEHVMARSFGEPEPKRVFTFPTIDHMNDVSSIRSGSGDVEALYIVDHARSKKFMAVVDWKAASTLVHELDPAIDIDPCGSYCPLAASFSFKEDRIVMLDIRDAELGVLELDLSSTGPREIATIPLSKGSLLEGKYGRVEIHRVGTLSDNSTVWIHWGDRLVFVDADGKVRKADLTKHAKVKKPEWAGPTLFVADPDQFYLGIEKGAGRYFMMVALEKLLAP